MSKKRPKTGSVRSGEKILHRDEPAFWETRVFHNTYDYQGRRKTAERWSVKIQHRRVRRTITLKARTRQEAGREACRLFRTIAEHGWEAVPGGRGAVGADVSVLVSGSAPPDERLNPACWRPRLIRRKYLNWLGTQSGPGGEWSVVIDHEGRQVCFPLQTGDADQAAIAAAERFGTIVRHGWKHAFLLYPREITLGIFWSDNPFACTYTTFLSFPATASGETPPSRSERPLRIVVVEPDGGVRRAMVYWLARQTKFAGEVVAAGRPSEARASGLDSAELILINRNLGGDRGHVSASLTGPSGREPIVFEYGVFEDSDHIFASLSGIPGGYFMRRRAPTDWLEPLGRLPDEPGLTRRRAIGGVRRYFQNLFNEPQTGGETGGPPPLLTHREYDILSLVSKGFQDKEIAGRLNISIWTVHSHLRSIFEKYQVHSRTEAVVKYLQVGPPEDWERETDLPDGGSGA